MKTGKDLFRFPGLLLFFLILTILMTYPTLFHMQKCYFGPDSLYTTWVFGWDLHKAQEGFKNLWDANIFYPSKGTLAYSEHLLGYLVLLIPLSLFTHNIFLIANIVLFCTFILSGVAMFYLVKYLTGDAMAAIISALIYAFYPYRFAQLGHMHVLSTFCFPFLFLYWHKSVRDPSLKNLVPFGLFFMCQATIGGYLGVYALFFTILSTAVYFTRERDVKRLLRITVAMVLLCLLLLIFFLPYHAIKNTLGYMEGGIPRWSANIFSLFLAMPGNNLWGWIYRHIPGNINPECLLFPGFLALLLAFAGIRSLAVHNGAIKRDRMVMKTTIWNRMALHMMSILIIMILVLCGILLLKGAGTSSYFGFRFQFRGMPVYFSSPLAILSSLCILFIMLRVLMDSNCRSRIREYWMAIHSDVSIYPVMLCTSFACTFYLFYQLLMRIFPGFSYMRVSARMTVIFMCALSVLAGFGVKSLLCRFGTGRGKILFIVALGAIILAEGASLPLTISEVPDPSPVYSQLPEGDVVLLELPASKALDPLYMCYSTAHWKKLVNGASGFQPGYYEGLMEELNKFPTAAGINFVRLLKVDFIILHGNFLPPKYRLVMRKKCEELDFLQYRGDFRGDYLYEVLKGKIPQDNQHKPAVMPEEISLGNCHFSTYPAGGALRNPLKTIDGDAATYWTSGRPQEKGQYFMIDLGRTCEVERIDLFLGQQCSGYPRNFVLLGSLDGRSWKYLQRQKGVVPLKSYLSDPRNPVFTIAFNRSKARFLSIVLTGGETECFWYIAEIKIYKPRGGENSGAQGN